MKVVSAMLFMCLLILSPVFWVRANNLIPSNAPEVEFRSIRGETHECKIVNPQEGQQVCKGLVTGKTVQVQSLKLSTHTGTWVPQSTKK